MLAAVPRNQRPQRLHPRAPQRYRKSSGFVVPTTAGLVPQKRFVKPTKRETEHVCVQTERSRQGQRIFQRKRNPTTLPWLPGRNPWKRTNSQYLHTLQAAKFQKEQRSIKQHSVSASRTRWRNDFTALSARRSNRRSQCLKRVSSGR